jgi:hypothetical protein
VDVAGRACVCLLSSGGQGGEMSEEMGNPGFFVVCC